MKHRIFDCITFYDENLLVNSRFEILNEVVDYFIICESKYDHKGNKKNINFFLKNQAYKNKVKHLVIEENFPDVNSGWKVEEYQREKILNALTEADDDDLILYSDSDEIPNPTKIKYLDLKNKYGIFMQKFFVYKLNIFNPHESPWEGTRVCRKKDLKSIDFMRQKVKSKNLKYNFFRIDKEKNIELFNNGGWHFNNIMSPRDISIKLKTFAHTEFSSDKFSDIKVIEKKINSKEDLFNRGHKYKVIKINKDFPKYILENIDKFNDYIIK